MAPWTIALPTERREMHKGCFITLTVKVTGGKQVQKTKAAIA